MTQIYNVLRIVHIIGGAIGLLTLAIPLVAKKGGTVHKKIGLVFTVAMVFASVTGMVIAVLWISMPLGIKQPPRTLDAEGIAAWEARIRSMGGFLGFTGILTLSSLAQGIGSIGRKHAPEGTRRPQALLLPLLTFSGGVALLVLGIPKADPLFIAFGALGVFLGAQETRFVVRPLESRMAWWYQHMRGMIAAGITGVTAFMVFNSNRLFGPLPGAMRVVPWIVPSLIGIPLMSLWVRRYMKKFREDGGRANAPRLASSTRAEIVE